MYYPRPEGVPLGFERAGAGNQEPTCEEFFNHFSVTRNLGEYNMFPIEEYRAMNNLRRWMPQRTDANLAGAIRLAEAMTRPADEQGARIESRSVPELRDRLSTFLLCSGRPPLMLPRPGKEYSLRLILSCYLQVDPNNFCMWRETFIGNLAACPADLAPALNLRTLALERLLIFEFDGTLNTLFNKALRMRRLGACFSRHRFTARDEPARRLTAERHCTEILSYTTKLKDSAVTICFKRYSVANYDMEEAQFKQVCSDAFMLAFFFDPFCRYTNQENQLFGMLFAPAALTALQARQVHANNVALYTLQNYNRRVNFIEPAPNAIILPAQVVVPQLLGINPFVRPNETALERTRRYLASKTMPRLMALAVYYANDPATLANINYAIAFKRGEPLPEPLVAAVNQEGIPLNNLVDGEDPAGQVEADADADRNFQNRGYLGGRVPIVRPNN